MTHVPLPVFAACTKAVSRFAMLPSPRTYVPATMKAPLRRHQNSSPASTPNEAVVAVILSVDPR